MVPEEATDPLFDEPGYASLCDEITARADHHSPHYRVDNAKLFEFLNKSVTEQKHVKTWIKLHGHFVMDVGHAWHLRHIIAEARSKDD
jgi:hypothetical protein